MAFDLTATFLFAITGTMAGMRRQYDIIGVIVLAFATALGGGLIRDGVFISAGPPVAVTNMYYLPVVTAAVIGTIIIGKLVSPVRRILKAVPISNDETTTSFAEPPSIVPTGAQPRSAQGVFERLQIERRLAKTYITVLALVDTVGLGVYAVVGVQKSVNRRLPLVRRFYCDCSRSGSIGAVRLWAGEGGTELYIYPTEVTV